MFTIDRSELERNTNNFGTKFAVQKLFYDLGMCEEKTALLAPNTLKKRLTRILEQFDVAQKGVTIRFSHKKKLNLPRKFFNNREKCIEFIQSVRKNYSIIIQEYRKLINSFELYYDDKLLYLQVIPGRWEISTSEPPDIVRVDGKEMTVWRYAKPRIAKFSSKDGTTYEEEVKPFGFKQLLVFYDRLMGYRDRLELLKQVYEPLFCHFYESDINAFSFLNMRNFGNFPINQDSPDYFHIINSREDIDKWDKLKPILFNVRGERENDVPLVITIKYLADKDVEKVYVNYGILSHPAILLREVGIRVEQSYSVYQKREFEMR